MGAGAIVGGTAARDAWSAQHKATIEQAFTAAVQAASDELADDPIASIIEHLKAFRQQRQSSDPYDKKDEWPESVEDCQNAKMVEAVSDDGSGASEDDRLAKVHELLRAGCEVNRRGRHGRSALHYACFNGHGKLVKALLDGGANPNALHGWNASPLHEAAASGFGNIVEQLLTAKADPSLRNIHDRKPLDVAISNRSAIVIRMLPGGLDAIKALCDKEMGVFQTAQVVHVISCRFTFAPGYDTFTSLNPAYAAVEIQFMLQKEFAGCKVFNPNMDNAFIMKGDATEANAKWLDTWRTMLRLAQETKGRVIQLLVKGGPSYMQKEEESMANDVGVPVVKVQLEHIANNHITPGVAWSSDDDECKPQGDVRQQKQEPQWEASKQFRDKLRLLYDHFHDHCFSSLLDGGEGLIVQGPGRLPTEESTQQVPVFSAITL